MEFGGDGWILLGSDYAMNKSTPILFVIKYELRPMLLFMVVIATCQHRANQPRPLGCLLLVFANSEICSSVGYIMKVLQYYYWLMVEIVE